MLQNLTTSFNRRDMLLLAGAAVAPNFVAGAANTDAESHDSWMDDPEKCFINYARLMGDLSGKISPQWWRGSYMGVFEDRHPEVFFRLESCEMKRYIRRSENEYGLQYRVFTMFLDPVTSEIMHGKRWRNPVTGKQVVVEPNISDAEHVLTFDDDKIVEVIPSRNQKVPTDVWWSAQGPYLMGHVDRERSPKRPIPLRDYLTLFCDRSAAADFDAPRLENRFSISFVSPFQRFMETPTELGISIWHGSGHKAESVASLPSRYKNELMKYRPDLRDWVGNE